MRKKSMIWKKAGMCMAAVVLLAGLTACGGKDESEGSSQGTGQTDPSQTLEESGDEAQGGSGEESSDGTASDAGEEDGVGMGESWSQEMEELKGAVVEALGEDYWPDMLLDPELLEGVFGISPDMYDDYMAEMPMISTNVDTLVIVKAKEGQVDAVEDALSAYRESRVENLMEYPSNVGKVQASRIERVGNYLLFVQLGADTMDAMEEGDEAVISQCLEANELVIEVVSRKLEH